MDDHLTVEFVETSDGANLHAIREFAAEAFAGNDVRHNVFSGLMIGFLTRLPLVEANLQTLGEHESRKGMKRKETVRPELVWPVSTP